MKLRYILKFFKKTAIMAFGFGLLVGIVGTLIHFMYNYSPKNELSENYWVPELETNKVEMRVASAMYFISGSFTEGEECSEKEVENFIDTQNLIFLSNRSNDEILCSKFSFEQVNFFWITKKNLDNNYLLLSDFEGNAEMVIRTSGVYPGNSIVVKKDEHGIVVFLEGYNNPAKTLLILFPN